MLFVVLAMVIYDFYPLTAVMIILLALLNDMPIMAIAYDNTYLSKTPVRWNMKRVLTTSTVLGLMAVIQTFGLMVFDERVIHLPSPQIQTMLFLQLLSAGALMLMVTRNRHAFWRTPLPSLPLLGAIATTQIIAILLAGFGWLVPQLPWKIIGLVWCYNLVWMVINDLTKRGVYRLLDNRARHQQKYLGSVNRALHSSAGS